MDGETIREVICFGCFLKTIGEIFKAFGTVVNFPGFDGLLVLLGLVSSGQV
jgi:hypothetical protein